MLPAQSLHHNCEGHHETLAHLAVTETEVLSETRVHATVQTHVYNLLTSCTLKRKDKCFSVNKSIGQSMNVRDICILTYPAAHSHVAL